MTLAGLVTICCWCARRQAGLTPGRQRWPPVSTGQAVTPLSLPMAKYFPLCRLWPAPARRPADLMGTTPNRKYPYPEPSAAVAKGAADMKALALALDAPPGYCRVMLTGAIAMAPGAYTSVGYTGLETERGYVTQTAGKSGFVLGGLGQYLIVIQGVWSANGGTSPTGTVLRVGWATSATTPSAGRWTANTGVMNPSPVLFVDQYRCTTADTAVVPMFHHNAAANLLFQSWASVHYLGQ